MLEREYQSALRRIAPIVAMAICGLVGTLALSFIIVM